MKNLVMLAVAILGTTAMVNAQTTPVQTTKEAAKKEIKKDEKAVKHAKKEVDKKAKAVKEEAVKVQKEAAKK